jgi:WD40 repeat protein
MIDWDTGAVRVVDVDTRTDVAPPFTTFRGFSWLNLSPDGRLAAIGSTDHTVRLYDLEARGMIGDPFTSTASLSFGYLTEDGRSLVVNGEPATLWDIDPASWRAKACVVAGRNLTRLEWQRYMPPDEPYRAVCPGVPIEA